MLTLFVSKVTLSEAMSTTARPLVQTVSSNPKTTPAYSVVDALLTSNHCKWSLALFSEARFELTSIQSSDSSVSPYMSMSCMSFCVGTGSSPIRRSILFITEISVR